MNFSPEKLFLVGIIALVVLGPNRLPQAARTAGRLLAEFRRVSQSLQSEMTQALAEPREVMQKSVGEFGLTNVRSQLRNTINEVVTGPSSSASGAGSTHGSVNGTSGNGSGGAEEPAAGAETPAPIVDPSRTLQSQGFESQGFESQGSAIEVNAQSNPARSSRGVPAPPDDPSLN